jgi:hypothetical protein
LSSSVKFLLDPRPDLLQAYWALPSQDLAIRKNIFICAPRSSQNMNFEHYKKHLFGFTPSKCAINIASKIFQNVKSEKLSETYPYETLRKIPLLIPLKTFPFETLQRLPIQTPSQTSPFKNPSKISPPNTFEKFSF